MAHSSPRLPSARGSLRLALLAAGFGALVFVTVPGCEKKMEPAACDKLRGDAFALLNKAHHCANDTDCRQSEWPGCQKPINNKDFDTIAPWKNEFTTGKCEEPKIDCPKETPASYCKQGLCVHREKGRNENDPKPEGDVIKAE